MTFTIFTTFLIFLTLLTLNYNYGFASKMTIHHSKHPTLKHFNKVNEESHGKGALSVIKSVYVTSIEIGHQKVFLVFDTGSRFTWVQWEKCEVCLPNEPPPIVAPYHRTDEFLFELCDRSQGGNNCNYRQDTPHSVCGSSTMCMYQVKYLDQSGSIGFVGTDIIAPFNDRNISHRMVFGIGLENRCYPSNYSCFQGVAGFGGGSLTIPSQLIPKPTRWAFCLPYNESMDGSFMVGEEAQIFGDYKTASLIDGAYFYLTFFSNISVIGRGIVPMDSMILIDTGTTLTYLEDSAFDSLVSMIKDLVDEKFDDFPIIVPYLSDLDLELCYKKPYQIEIVIVFEDAYIHIDDPQKVWLKFSENAYCLSFKRNGESPYSILGSYHIRGYKVVYDLNPENPTIQVSTGQDETGCFTPVTA